MIAGVSFDRERMAAAASDELIAATDVADLPCASTTLPRGAFHGRRIRARSSLESGLQLLGAGRQGISPRRCSAFRYADELRELLAKLLGWSRQFSEADVPSGAFRLVAYRGPLGAALDENASG